MTDLYSEIDPRKVAMIIGAMKCGTGSLFRMLEQHPQVCGSDPKEPEYFSRYQVNSGLVKPYVKAWQGCRGSVHEWRLEASTGYTKAPEESGVPERIRSFGLRPRFFYVVRDPVSRIQSHCAFVLQRNGLRLDPEDEHVVSISSYHRQLERFERVFGRRSLAVFTTEELAECPGDVANRAFAHLGIDAFDVTPVRANVTSTQQASALHWFLGRSSTVRRQVRRYVPATWSKKVASASRSLLPAHSDPLVLEPPVIDRLRERLEPDMRRLSTDYGIDTSVWGFS